MNAAFKAYFDQIKNLDVNEATEHTLRPALDTFLKALAAAINLGERVGGFGGDDIKETSGKDTKYGLTG